MLTGNKVLAVGALLCVGVVCVFLLREPTPIDAPSRPRPTNEGVRPSVVTSAAPRETSVPHCIPPKQPLSQVSIVEVLAEQPRSDSFETQSYISPDRLIALAQNGDSLAAISLFKMLSSCYPNGVHTAPRKECPQVERRLIEDRFSILEPLALKGIRLLRNRRNPLSG